MTTSSEPRATAEPAIGDAAVLEAALEQFQLVGIKRSTTDDIAARAGINRVTLYRRFGNKDAIVRAAMGYEVNRVLARIESEAAGIDDVVQRFQEGFVFTVTMLREHPLLKQALAADRDATLAAMTFDAAGVLQAGTTFIGRQIDRARAELGLAPSDQTETIAAVMVRLVQSLVLTPEGPLAMTEPDELRAFAATTLLALMMS